MDSHAVVEVVVAGYEDVLGMVLEDEARTFVEAVEVLDGGDDGFCGIVRRDHDSHGKTSTILAFWEEQLEGDLLLLSSAWRGPAIGIEGGRWPCWGQHGSLIWSRRQMDALRR